MDFEWDFDLDDPFNAEQLEWLEKWCKLMVDGKDTDSKDSKRKKHLEDILKFQDQLKDAELENMELKKENEMLIYDLQFVRSQKEELTIERDTISLKLKEEEAMHQSLVKKLEEQICTFYADYSSRIGRPDSH